MDNQIRENFDEKLRLIHGELISSLDSSFEAMLRTHSAKGLLRSGNTIKATMELISKITSTLYSEVILHLEALNLKYYSALESDILLLANESFSKLKKELIVKFKKSTEMAGNPDLFDRMLPEVENEMAKHLATFRNRLNLQALELKRKTTKSPVEKILWALEVAIILASMFIAGMWFKDPQGNYEPILVGLGLVTPLIYLGIRRAAKQ